MGARASAGILEPDANLLDLRNQTLVALVRAAALVAYMWAVFSVWPITGWRADPMTRLGCVALVVGVALTHLVRKVHTRAAAIALVGSMILSVSFLIVGTELPQFAYFYSIPIIVASILLGPHISVFVGLIAGLGGATLSATILRLPLLSPNILLPVLATLLTTVASWLTGRDLYTALAWAWNGYDRAREQEESVRQRGSELRQALKSLDEATYRLERTNHMLVLARRQAEDARKVKQQFAQTISHELRTPLNLIVGFSELMAQSPEYYGVQLPANYVRDLSVVHRNARHLEQLVSDVLDLSRIEAAQMSLVLQESDPAQLVAESVNMMQSLVESRGLALETSVDPRTPAVWVDPMRIRQVLVNLLNNAARYTDEGSVSVRAFHQNGEVIFTVSDTGVGIDAKDLPRLFDEFQQATHAGGQPRGGIGLGLAICQRFVALHGGRIWAESQVGQGSVFSFSLPVEHSEFLGVEDANPEGQGQEGRHEREHVLLAVTRSPSAAALLTHYVLRTRTVVVQSLEKLASAAREFLPQAVVVDTLSFPVGVPEIKSLIDSPLLAETPVVLCPLPGEESLRQEMAVDGYLIKPVSKEALWDALRPFGDDVDRVLVVDDDREFVRLLARMLEDPVRRYDVTPAHSAQEGIEILRRWTPDLMLLDLDLPDFDGTALLERMQAEGLGKGLPVVVVSGCDESDTQQALGGDVIISKREGLTPGEVVRHVQSVVDSAALRRPPTTKENHAVVEPARAPRP